MTSAERTAALYSLGLAIAAELRILEPLRPWTAVEPTEDVYSVYLQNGNGARIYLHFDSSKGYDLNDRVLVTGHMHLGKNGSYVEVYDRGADGTGWNKVSTPRITIGLSKNPEAIAKDIAKRFLPEYLRVFALAQAKVQADADYEAKITANLQRLAAVANVPRPSKETALYGKVNNQFSFRVGENRYYTVTASAKDCSLKLDTLSFEQAEVIIRYLKSGKM
jgi:hypothetical protein